MQVITAAEFKLKCLKIMDDVAATHEEILITKRGKAIAKIVPVESTESPFGFLKGTVSIKHDIVDFHINEPWEANE